ncbi:MAG: redox-regulated ATPase YchF [Dehalococcoidales bacterium]|nr:redox-regulated ATPase YchF [Dehalococcoidales bacterium]
MAISLGLVGLPNAGKSTLFNALTKAGAQVANYPFTTIEPNVGIVPVPDPRLADVARIAGIAQLVPTTVEFVDIAGLVEGSSHGEGLGNQFLGHIRNVDAVVFVLRCFHDPDVVHMYGAVDPVRDAEILGTELMLADLATAERQIEKIEKTAKFGDKSLQRQLAALTQVHEHLAEGRPARTLAAGSPAAEAALAANLLTAKPVLYVANVDEDDLAQGTSPEIGSVRQLADADGACAVAISARLESELTDLGEEDAASYLATLGLTESGLVRLVQESYRLLDLVTFFTAVGGKEVRAWTVTRGTKAPQAAGKVHSDMERGFIRAEVVSYAQLVADGSFAVARERGQLRLEGRDYVVQDGDIITFRFNI